jgi:hypothetical protein
MRGLGDDIAAVDVDLGPERLESGEVQVDGPRPDRTPAGQ